MLHSERIYRLLLALVVGAAITFVGGWAYMAHIHDQAEWQLAAVVISMPFAALANVWNFFHSNVVYWASIVGGFILWTLIGYRALCLADRRPFIRHPSDQRWERP